jgi:pyruvate kinase
MTPVSGSVVESIMYSAAKVAEHVGAVAVACITHTGTAVRTLAKYRPKIPIIAIMDNPASLRKLAFVWGVEGIVIPAIVPTDDLWTYAANILQASGRAEPDDMVLITAGVPSLGRGTTNAVKVHRVTPLPPASKN